MPDTVSSELDVTSEGPLSSRERPLGGREATVLVVDDEPSNVASLEKIFQREGLRVLTAENARQALEQLRRHRVEVILTDLMMPGTNGVELLRAVKELSPDVEVVLMT